jgi:cyclophilin family peptidyl-prolyl cis-trans isomerase
VPSQKRARKRAARQARQAALERRTQRRAALRRALVVLAAAAAGVGIYAAVSSGKSHRSAGPTTTTTVAGSVTATSVPDSTTTTVSLAGDTTSANCPKHFTATTRLEKPTFTSPPPMIIDPAKSYTATVRTDVGTFTIALDAKDSPVTVNNFVFLAENHYYDCVVFHRVIQGFVVQGGDPTGTGTGGVGYTVQGELPKSGTYPLYSVAMAKTSSEPNGTAGSQFFIVAGSQGTSLPVQYAYLGQVTAGTSVVQRIDADGAPSNDPTGTGTPRVLHRMISVTISSS